MVSVVPFDMASKTESWMFKAIAPPFRLIWLYYTPTRVMCQAPSKNKAGKRVIPNVLRGSLSGSRCYLIIASETIFTTGSIASIAPDRVIHWSRWR